MQRRTFAQSIAAIAAPAVLTRARASSRVRVGVSLPFTSVQSAVATDMQAGLSLAFARARERGIEIVPEWEDDKSQPDMTAQAMESFGRDPSFVATTSIVGTPHAIKALPVVQRLGLPVVGLRSGAAELRDGLPGVFHLRASFNDEVNRIVTMLAGADMHRIAVVYSDDAFGRATMQQVRVAAAAKKIEVVTAIAAERNGSNVQQMVSAAVGQVSLGKQPLALLMLMIAEPMEKGVRHAREQLNYLYPIFAMSFCATKALAESQAPHLLGLGLMSAFPLPRSEVSPLSRDFMRLAKALKAGAEVSMTSFEAFFYASTLTEAIHQAKEPTRDGIRAALRAQLNVGGYRVAFDRVNVGYHYLTALRKSHDGVLRA